MINPLKAILTKLKPKTKMEDVETEDMTSFLLSLQAFIISMMEIIHASGEDVGKWTMDDIFKLNEALAKMAQGIDKQIEKTKIK